jgi:hypothetical protein
MIQYYNMVAALNTLPIFDIVGYKVVVNNGSSTGSGSTIDSVDDISDYVTKTNALIAATKHNSLKDIQGGNETERYHFTAEQHRRLLALIMVQPTVSISLLSSIPAATNGVYEKGTSVSSFIVKGAVTLNDGGKHTKSVYNVAGVDVKTYELENELLASYDHRTPITDTTTVKFLASFTEATMKEASLQLKFDYPYYTALGLSGKGLADLTTTKTLMAKPSQINASYEIPVGNATSSTPVMPYLFTPVAWGEVKTIGANGLFTFDYINSFTRSLVVVTLPDGTTANYYKYEYQTATQGNMTFNFKF